MAVVNYRAILDALGALLRADSRILTLGARVYVEEDPTFGLADVQNAIAIYPVRRTIHPNQALAAGKNTRWLLELSVWCFGFALQDFKSAADIRDLLLDQLEVVLNDNRTISATVEFMNMGGGDFPDGRNPDNNVFVAGVETTIICTVSAISP